MTTPLLRIGTRGSPLALIQAEAVRQGLTAANAELAVPGAAFEVEIIGQRRPARLLAEPVLDPAGQRMRA